MRRIALFLLLCFVLIIPAATIGGIAVSPKYTASPKNVLKALPELKVAYDKNKLLHILAYVREY
ncbi:MAG: hypothetical protein K2J78_00730, partial [Muribaculaceae bacterium]|nr:hypothetical protein [Muribaculaceae bacterium]